MILKSKFEDYTESEYVSLINRLFEGGLLFGEKNMTQLLTIS